MTTPDDAMEQFVAGGGCALMRIEFVPAWVIDTIEIAKAGADIEFVNEPIAVIARNLPNKMRRELTRKRLRKAMAK